MKHDQEVTLEQAIKRTVNNIEQAEHEQLQVEALHEPQFATQPSPSGLDDTAIRELILEEWVNGNVSNVLDLLDFALLIENAREMASYVEDNSTKDVL